MRTEQFNEGNKLICKYIGDELDNDTVIVGSGKRLHISEYHHQQQWDALIPVWSKAINELISLSNDGKIDDWHYIDKQNDFLDATKFDNVLSAFQIVVSAIELINTHKSKQDGANL